MKQNDVREAIEFFEGCKMHCGNPDFIDMAISALQAQAERRWIPVSERLPKETENQQDIFDPITLGYIDTEYHMVSEPVNVTVLNHDNGEKFVCDDMTVDGKWVNFNGDFKVTHWMPLPQTPKEDCNDNQN